jgi:hypothetical protein
MKNKHVIFFVITDLHLGKFGKTERLVSNLISYFNTHKKQISKSDVLVLDGDTFDKMLSTSSHEYKLAIQFISYLVQYCKLHNIKLRVLEGTPSHDNKQMEAISEAVGGFGNIDYKYIPSIQIEYMKEYDKHILYVPDKMGDTGLEIQDKIDTVLIENGLAKVDLVFVHGNFKYQLPISLKSELSEEFFLDICKYYIVSGHIHIRSIFKRIIVPGSFDRLEVNNEAPKGGVFLYIGDSIDSSSFEFLDNSMAMRCDTLILLNSNSKEVYRKVKRYVEINNYTKDDHLRLKLDSNEIFTEIKNRLIADGYGFRIEPFIEPKLKKHLEITKYPKAILLESFEINKDNVYKLLEQRRGVSELEITEKDRIKQLLLECS